MKPNFTVERVDHQTNRITAHLGNDKTDTLDVPRKMGINVHDIIDFFERVGNASED